MLWKFGSDMLNELCLFERNWRFEFSHIFKRVVMENVDSINDLSFEFDFKFCPINEPTNYHISPNNNLVILPLVHVQSTLIDPTQS